MLRDFSETSKHKLLGLVSEVENEKYCDLTDWLQDRWYDFESWIGVLNIKNYINDINTYHKKVIDKNNATKDSIEKIFNNISSVNSTYSIIFENINLLLSKWIKYIDNMNDIVAPGNGKFNSKFIKYQLDNSLKNINSSSTQCLKDRMIQNINGELIFNEELIYEYFKKDQSELSDEEQKMLIDVISQLQETVVIYETIASYGTDKLGMDIIHYVSWMTDNTNYNSFTAVSAHYNDIYVNILNFMLEQSEDSNTFASSLIKASNGNSDLTLFGTEYTQKLHSLFDGEALAIYVSKYVSEHTEQYFVKLEANEKENLKASGKFKNVNDAIEDKLKDAGKLTEIDRKTEYRDVDGNTVKKDNIPTFYKKQLNLAELKKSVSASVSLYDGTFNTFEDGNINIVVGNAEAHSNISAGLYVVGADGEKKFSPGVNAEIGGSVTALDINWEQQWLGDEMWGLNTDAEVTAGKIEGKADIGAQLYDENGKLDVQLGASAKVEAIAAEAKGSVGLNVLGGEVGIGGSINFGIGAHADIGYKDGVFKFDIGASVGLGASINAEIDIGGMVDTVCDTASAAWNGLKDGWKKITSWW